MPNSSDRPLADRLAAYADGLRYDDLDGATIERVKSHVIDTIGCGIAAFDERPVRVCREVALANAGGASSVIGTDRRTSPDLAAFANSVASRYYDLNDANIGVSGLTGDPANPERSARQTPPLPLGRSGEALLMVPRHGPLR